MRHLLLMAFIPVFSQESQWDVQIENIYNQMKEVNKINQIEEEKKNSIDLSVLTINLGLLNLPIVRVPYYNDRSELLSPIMEDFIVGKRPGVLFIQELCHKNDFDVLTKLALSLDYIPIIHDYNNIEKKGLQILIDRKMVQEEFIDGEFLEYMGKKGPVKAWYEEMFNYKRGLLHARITLFDGKKNSIGQYPPDSWN